MAIIPVNQSSGSIQDGLHCRKGQEPRKEGTGDQASGLTAETEVVKQIQKICWGLPVNPQTFRKAQSTDSGARLLGSEFYFCVALGKLFNIFDTKNSTYLIRFF